MNPRKLLLVVGVIVAVGWVLVARLIVPGDSSESQARPSPPPAPKTVRAEDDPQPLANEKRIKMRLARQFVAAYYARDELLFAGSPDQRTTRFKARLRPYVSEDFLAKQGVLPQVPQDLALIRSGGSIRAGVAFFSGGHGDEISVTIKRTIENPDDQPEQSFTPILLTLTKAEYGWVVDLVTEMV